jgi:hypothetical protein
MFKLFAVLLAACLNAGAIAHAQNATVPAVPLFEPIASVLMHPRCLNCHQTDFPRERDSGIRHTQLVVRGANDEGAPTLQCSACHQTSNTADGRVPGAEGWQLPPRSMNWEGLTKTQICAAIKDPSKNGNRHTLREVVRHMKVDPLVLWAWEPGAGRSMPALSHEEFVHALDVWVAAGGPC